MNKVDVHGSAIKNWDQYNCLDKWHPLLKEKKSAFPRSALSCYINTTPMLGESLTNHLLTMCKLCSNWFKYVPFVSCVKISCLCHSANYCRIIVRNRKA